MTLGFSAEDGATDPAKGEHLPSETTSSEPSPPNEARSSKARLHAGHLNAIQTDLTNRVIRASAGTGKTFQLTNRFLALLLNGVSADRILATTFTRKAAGEILDRVMLRLANAALDSEEQGRLSSFLEIETVAESRLLEILQHLLRSLHRLRIGTLDSFFVQLARSFSLEFGLPASWRVVDPVAEATYRDEAVEAMLREERTSDVVNLAHLLSKGETQRSVAEMVRTVVDDLHSLFLDSDPRAWKRLSASGLLDGETLRRLGDELEAIPFSDGRLTKARDADLERANREDWEEFAMKGMAAKVLAGVEEYYRRPIPSEALRLYGQLLDHARAILIHRLANQNEGAYELLVRYDREYQQLRNERRVLRFSDVTRELAARLAKASSLPGAVSLSSHALTYRLDGQIDHLLLDEFQDTAPMQWRVLQPFARHTVRPSTSRTFLCVGDTKQAIYGWRGGVAEIFDAVEGQLPGLDEQQLNTSFRSSPPVIETVNRVFQSIDRHANLGKAANAVRAWKDRFQVHATARSEMRGYVALQTAPESTDDSAGPDAVLDFAAEMVAQLSRDGRESIGILVRRNATVGRLIYRLRRRDVAASEEGGNTLIDSAAVQVLMSALRLADHPGDTIARFHIANSPLAGYFQLADVVDDGQACRAAMRARRQILEEGYGPAIAAWGAHLLSRCSLREKNRLGQFVELAYAYQGQATLRTDDFLRLVEQQRIADPSSAGVRVMTVHQAKGLEFETVILPELDFPLTGQPDRFVVERKDPTGPVDRICHYVNQDLQPLLPPSIQRMFEATADRWATESLCVLYVALTRAVRELRMIVAPSKSERAMPKSYGGLLRAALTDRSRVPPDTMLYELGDPSWARTPAPSSTMVAPPVQSRAVTIALAPNVDSKRRGRERVSPSSLEGGARVHVGDILQAENQMAAVRGTLVHALFEHIAWLEDGTPSIDRLVEIAEATLVDIGGAPVDLNRLCAEFESLLKQPALDALLRRSAYERIDRLPLTPPIKPPKSAEIRVAVETERRFAIREDNQILNGSIDRLVWIHVNGQLVAADVIDFKTDRVDPQDPAGIHAKIAYYRPQLVAYRRTIVRMTGLSPGRVAARLVFVDADRIEEIPREGPFPE